MEDRKKALEAFAKQLSLGDESSSKFLDPNMNEFNLSQKAFGARNLAEDALANEVLKNTGVPIPNPGASRLKQEDFMNRILQERYPELTPDVRVADLSKHDALGLYVPDKAIIGVDKKLTSDPIKSVSTLLHEGGHQYDDKVLKYNMPDELLKSKNQHDIKGMYKKALDSDIEPDASQLFNTAAKGHHARIPNVRDADSFGFGALKSMMKSGTFKALPIIGGAAAVGTALSSPDASAAVGDALVPGGLESLGPSADDAAIENPQANPEARRQALQRMRSGR